MRSTASARIVREAGKAMNAPRALAVDLNAGQLLARVQDGLGFLRDAGFLVEFHAAPQGKVRLSIYRQPWAPLPPAGGAPGISPGEDASGAQVDAGGEAARPPGVPVATGDTWVDVDGA